MSVPMHVYLFEAKSIQSYLFQSGKLKDVIAASERLDRLIDDAKNSVLSQVLALLSFSHDLHQQLDIDTPSADCDIHFIRNKGGAIRCVSSKLEALQAFRSVWTLTVQQLFPSLPFIDALATGDDLKTAIKKASDELNLNRQQLHISFPYAEAINSRYSRTGQVAVPVSKMAGRAQHPDEAQNDAFLDLDVEQHRQAYQYFELRDNAALQDRFTPDSLKRKIYYPIDFEQHFDFTTSSDKEAAKLNRTQKEAVKDLALIHVDGNGLGMLLMALIKALPQNDDATYRLGFRMFSDALNKSTLAAAQQATKWLYDFVINEGQVNYTKEDTPRLILPMRPIVLGGDDITLFCRADLALDYARKFCTAFEKASKEALAPLFDKYLKKSEMEPFLTASGGVLFHKVSHPFMQCHHLVEQLCDKAKDLTKGLEQGQTKGGAALAFYRIINASNEDLKELIERNFILNDSLQLGRASYFVDKQDTPNFSQLEALLQIASTKEGKSPMPINRWRQMATELALRDLTEAKRIYDRGLDLYAQYAEQSKDKITQLEQVNHSFYPNAGGSWFDEQTKQTYIQDLLIFAHYQAVVADQNPKSEDNQ